MQRYRLSIEYDGRAFVGWQRQANGFSVQEALETAIHGFCGETATVHAAGRTDAGVHALGQVVHFDLGKDAEPGTVADALNAHVRPHPVAVTASERVDDSFHARFSATGRAYRYRIVNRRAPLTVDRGLAWWVPTKLDAGAMHEAAQVLLGAHDFTSFRSVMCQAKSAEKTLDRLDVTRDGDEIVVVAEARSFLHNQVRIMTGTLRQAGEGKLTPDDMRAIVEACDRTKAGETAPPDGLYLTGVRYG